jgi:hypothetical protein
MCAEAAVIAAGKRRICPAGYRVIGGPLCNGHLPTGFPSDAGATLRYVQPHFLAAQPESRVQLVACGDRFSPGGLLAAGAGGLVRVAGAAEVGAWRAL